MSTLKRIIDPFNAQKNLDNLTALVSVADESLFDKKAWWSQFGTYSAKSFGNSIIGAVGGIAVAVGGLWIAAEIEERRSARKNQLS